jgi:Peptidase family M28/PA domain
LPITAPVWEPVEPWEIIANGDGERLPLTSAQPAYGSVAAPNGGLNLEAVYVGTGSDADFHDRDVRGKAVVVYSVPFPAATWETARSERVYQRAEEKGAAAILVLLAVPGNLRVQGYTTGGKIPTFTLGMEDGYALRELIGRAPAGRPPHIAIHFETRAVSNLKSATVWGRLPGATDETVYVMAHRDGWFDGASDNASGVASMLGLAEYFARMSRAQRRRTIVFMGVSGHHGPAVSSQDLLARRAELFAKTALLINAEHTSTLQTYLYWNAIRPANTFSAQFWYAGGPSRPALQEIAIRAFRAFGVTTYAAPEHGAPPGDLTPLWRFVPSVTTTDFNMYFHSDGETPEMVPWTGLEATTRAYAMIIDRANALPLADLQRAGESAGRLE